jgi:tetratricopeptide (TPR) repeat protein
MSDPLAAGLLATGLAHHRAGRLADAEQCYRRLLIAQPDNADGLHLLGLLALAARRFDAAIELISRAIVLIPGNVAFHYNLGIVLRDAGRLEDSAARYREAVRLDPSHVEAWANLSVVLTELKRPSEAVAACDRALSIAPDHASAWYNRGNADRDLGRLEEALADYDRALRVRSDMAEAHSNRGITLGDLGRWPEAVVSYEHALALRPDDAGFHYNLGIALRAVGEPERAIEHYDRCLALDSLHAQALANRANALGDVGRVAAALADLDNALTQRPNDPEILYNRGVMLETAHRFEDALVEYRRALSLRPRFPECAHNLGLALAVLGRLKEAWPLLESRFHVRGFPGRPRDFPQPRWIGDALNGRTLLIHAEQGFGDTIQFSRYAAAIGAAIGPGGRVIMEVPRALRRLMTGLPGVDLLLEENEKLPSFDVHCPMMSLALAFDTGIDTIPPPSVLRGFGTPPVLPSGPGPRIGIAWSGNPAHGNDRKRSMPLRAMLPLLSSAGMICSLQTFMSDADREVLRATPEIVDLGCGFQDFADTAAAIMALDLVISVDTSVAHLAATLGRPTWILLPFRPEWRWGLEREDSAWYPSARLFRQREAGDWDGVIARVGAALRAWHSATI